MVMLQPFVLPLLLLLLFGRATRGIVVPRPGIEPVSPAMEGWSPNHWTAREFLVLPLLTWV